MRWMTNTAGTSISLAVAAKDAAVAAKDPAVADTAMSRPALHRGTGADRRLAQTARTGAETA
jgi:hypothetical protein